jgi:predicted phage terminase large subunit-like protein
MSEIASQLVKALPPSEAARLLLEREEVRRSFTAWCRRAGFEPAKHHRLMIRHLEDVSRGTCRRLALFLPPGSAKSTYASVLYPPWHLQKHRDHAIIAASHTQELGERWGRRTRNLVEHFSHVLGLSLAGDARAAGRWETDQGGEYFAAGVGASITGRRADLGIIDDPVRSREDADSESIRHATWEWYVYDFLPRLKPNAAVVLIQTRWHEDDLAGRILEAEGIANSQDGDRTVFKDRGGQWTVVRLPMLAEADDPLQRAPGERLWPDWFTDEMVEQAKRDTRVWSALYQQSPTPDTGDYFRAEWLHPVDHLPKRDSVNLYGASDYAVTSKGGDYTVHIVVGVDSDGRMTVMDLWRGQTDSAEWIESWCDMVKDWRPLSWAEEKGQINASVGPFLLKRQRERRAYTFRRQFPPRHDKAVRARSIQARMATEGLYIPKSAPWRADFEAELLRFPAAKHDDQVDALGLIGQLLDVVRSASSSAVPAPDTTPSGYSPYYERQPSRRLSALDL